MKLSERRARERGRKTVAAIGLVQSIQADLPNASLAQVVLWSLDIEEALAPLRAEIGPAVALRENTDDPMTRGRLDRAAAELWPLVESMAHAQTMLVERAQVLVAEQGGI